MFSVFPHVALCRAALLPGVAEQGGECPAESGDLLAAISGKRNRLGCAFQGRDLWVFPSPEHQSVGLSCPQEWLPPAPEEGGHGEPGALEFGHWGGRGEDFRPLALGAEPCWGWVDREEAGPAPPAPAMETF